jgi:membrane-associated phospholipid phosphatase
VRKKPEGLTIFRLKLLSAKNKRAVRPLLIWIASLIATAVMVVISYQWLDRPLALLVHEHLRSPNDQAFVRLTHIPEPFYPLAVVIFVGLGLWALAGRQLSKHQAAAFLCSMSVLFAEATKDQLKFLFGRTWPETWVQNNPSFIKDGAYGFNFMHAGTAYQSFPSGHTAAISAVISVLWILYPKLRILCTLAVLAVAIGLIGANYHFLGDVIAGAFVGISTGCFATTLWQMRHRRNI